MDYPENYIAEHRIQIGASIRKLREQQGLSQEELAANMDVQRSTISKIETGKFSVSLDYLVKVLWHLGGQLIITKENPI